MLITITSVIVCLVSIIIMYLADNTDKYAFVECGFGLFIISFITTFIAIVMITTAHIGVNAKIERNRIEYESLCDRYELIASEYEDMSKSDVIRDIAEWNKTTYSYKYWAYNPWTSWFHSQRVADELQMIEKK